MQKPQEAPVILAVVSTDVHFRTGSSHSDMLECVEAAVLKVIEMGYADPKRIGINVSETIWAADGLTASLRDSVRPEILRR